MKKPSVRETIVTITAVASLAWGVFHFVSHKKDELVNQSQAALLTEAKQRQAGDSEVKGMIRDLGNAVHETNNQVSELSKSVSALTSEMRIALSRLGLDGQ